MENALRMFCTKHCNKKGDATRTEGWACNSSDFAPRLYLIIYEESSTVFQNSEKFWEGDRVQLFSLTSSAQAVKAEASNYTGTKDKGKWEEKSGIFLTYSRVLLPETSRIDQCWHRCCNWSKDSPSARVWVSAVRDRDHPHAVFPVSSCPCVP